MKPPVDRSPTPLRIAATVAAALVVLSASCGALVAMVSPTVTFVQGTIFGALLVSAACAVTLPGLLRRGFRR